MKIWFHKHFKENELKYVCTSEALKNVCEGDCYISPNIAFSKVIAQIYLYERKEQIKIPFFVNFVNV